MSFIDIIVLFQYLIGHFFMNIACIVITLLSCNSTSHPIVYSSDHYHFLNLDSINLNF